MILYPKYYFKKVTDIDIEFLNKNNIKGLILDVDNTLIDFDLNIIDGAKNWCDNLKAKGIKMVIVSNTNKRSKVERVANFLDISYVFKAMKPFKKGLKIGKEILNLENENLTQEIVALIYSYCW